MRRPLSLGQRPASPPAGLGPRGELVGRNGCCTGRLVRAGCAGPYQPPGRAAIPGGPAPVRRTRWPWPVPVRAGAP